MRTTRSPFNEKHTKVNTNRTTKTQTRWCYSKVRYSEYTGNPKEMRADAKSSMISETSNIP
ncbi:hypothetical protein SERLA73DRAFT_137617 [Serpula lacrymans var. lacrymans S7.3]|uniref:Uncharacterized protein n=2 Tax=Serpula lacrymans var. lacrymans TaxID=341189 RepID=F8PWZ4_SERL3|nr:uncharacterized protein SERLADRAFT_390822 [Serpula lacrymans var. lacrymans S7.9]EGN99321.1 hypothetical protein SERLA73DRAFT_137617 [Serpula lacrymans var. lacrymans S7.3]EGO24885.1 hypothetical protein SERLADRAFT_390822 [Serpula lacrymans var. lacrymans S7.9]